MFACSCPEIKSNGSIYCFCTRIGEVDFSFFSRGDQGFSTSLFIFIFSRVKHGPQEFVPEGLFDDSINLVVWGHEHDCRIIPEPVAGKSYYITQPGSSVATSLADGEAIEK